MANECVTTVLKGSPMPGGEKFIRGTFKFPANYYTSGNKLNLANSLKGTGSPTVVISGGSGYVLQHNQGTAQAGLIKAYMQLMNAANGVDGNVALVEVDANTDLSGVNATFFAAGPAY